MLPGVGTIGIVEGRGNRWTVGGINGIPLYFTRLERWKLGIDGFAGRLTNNK
jgi:hypothetical protein